MLDLSFKNKLLNREMYLLLKCLVHYMGPVILKDYQELQGRDIQNIQEFIGKLQDIFRRKVNFCINRHSSIEHYTSIFGNKKSNDPYRLFYDIDGLNNFKRNIPLFTAFFFTINNNVLDSFAIFNPIDDNVVWYSDDQKLMFNNYKIYSQTKKSNTYINSFGVEKLDNCNNIMISNCPSYDLYLLLWHKIGKFILNIKYINDNFHEFIIQLESIKIVKIEKKNNIYTITSY